MRGHTPPRPIEGIAAVLLPFDAGGQSSLDAFGRLVKQTAEAGLGVAVNMDTGFGPELSQAERRAILMLTRDVLGPGIGFVAGAMPFGHDEEDESAYRAEIEAIVSFGATPIVFPSPGLGEDVVGFHQRVLADVPRALAFELGPMFAPFGRIYGPDEIKGLMAVPSLVGLKHSSLDRRIEWQRLDVRDAERPDFRIYTGNDLAIDMVCYGSDYLLGLASFDPAAFALRDRWWAEGDERFFGLNDALQAVGTVAFREPVPAYKDTAVAYLELSGKLGAGSRPHPSCPSRPPWERELLEPLAARVAALTHP